MNMVYQPPGSNLCGPAVVASIAGVTLDAAISACGKCGLTRSSHLKTGLAVFGWEVGQRKAPRCLPRVDTWLVRVAWADRKTHWVILADGHFYDPAHGIDPSYSDWGGRVTSIWPILRNNNQSLHISN